jgi:hypothetical protein
VKNENKNKRIDSKIKKLMSIKIIKFNRRKNKTKRIEK